MSVTYGPRYLNTLNNLRFKTQEAIYDVYSEFLQALTSEYQSISLKSMMNIDHSTKAFIYKSCRVECLSGSNVQCWFDPGHVRHYPNLISLIGELNVYFYNGENLPD